MPEGLEHQHKKNRKFALGKNVTLRNRSYVGKKQHKIKNLLGKISEAETWQNSLEVKNRQNMFLKNSVSLRHVRKLTVI